MRRIRIFSIVFCAASAIIFFVYLFNTRQILDSQGPVITMDRDTIEISVTDDDSVVLDGVTAKDNRDGDTTEYLLVEQFTNFLEDGRRQVTIAAFDKAGNVTKTTREVVYTDYESPRFTLTAPFSFPVNTSTITKNISVVDCLDGDITASIKLSSEAGVTLTKAGLYEAIFTISNSAGDTAKLPVTVEIYDSSARSRQPNILLTDYLIYVEKDETFKASSYIKEVYYGNRGYRRDSEGVLRYYGSSAANQTLPSTLSAGDFEIDNPVDTSVPGVYEVTYSYSWEDSDPGTVRLIVVVTD